ncbi:uncharacterized protein TrAFT101_010427 [Trichoderma asperellum]|uniref:uncharacterized protein n=1 Tax=Trichoderma asperellum TaxID=101201 RepID=UPI00331A464D|nr:hypothetical protein TrAFT101_010427 [Trichoderma asperellum]
MVDGVAPWTHEANRLTGLAKLGRLGSPSIDQEGIAYAEWSAQEWGEGTAALAVARLPRAMLGGGS